MFRFHLVRKEQKKKKNSHFMSQNEVRMRQVIAGLKKIGAYRMLTRSRVHPPGPWYIRP